MKAKWFGWLVLALILLTGVPSAFAALNAYLYMVGDKAGPIQGSVTQKGREGSIMVIAYSHNISVPINATSGEAAGKLRHDVLTITKETDRSTPILYGMLVNNDTIKEFKLEFWQPSAAGKEIQHYTIKLTNARIV